MTAGHALDDSTLVAIEIEGNPPEASSLGEFLDANADAIDAAEAARIRETLSAGGVVVLGGGAAPEVELRVAVETTSTLLHPEVIEAAQRTKRDWLLTYKTSSGVHRLLCRNEAGRPVPYSFVRFGAACAAASRYDGHVVSVRRINGGVR